MKKIIGWFKNIFIRILEVIDYMIKKDNEIELAKLEIAKDVLKDKKTLSCVAIGIGVAGLLLNSSNSLTDRKQIVLACAGVGMSIGLGIGMSVGLLYIHFHNSNIPTNIL